MKNPKQKLKNILLLFTALLIVSCSKDNYEDLSLKENNFKINHVKFKDLKTAENKNLAKSVNSLISYQKSSKTNKLVYNETYDFYIDEENGIYVNINGKETYTFPIYKSQSDGTVENLIFNEEENGGFSIILADYSLTKNQLDNLNHAPSEGEVQYYDMSRFDVTELMCIDRYSYEDTGELVGADSQPFYDWILTGSYCWWNQGGGGSLGDTDSSGGNTGGELGDGSGGSGGGGSGGSVVTSPNSGLTIAQYQFLSQLNKLTAGETFYTFDEITYNNILNYVEANNSNTLLISSIAYFLNNTNTLWLSNQSTQTQQNIFNYLITNGFSTASKNKINQLINYLMLNPSLTFEEVFYNKTEFDVNSSNETGNYTSDDFDTNTYSDFNPQQNWTNIPSVIPISQFIGWGAPGIKRNCMDYAKAQIAKKGYQISAYNAVGQTYQIYTSQNGVNATQLSQGLSYLKYALSNGIPVIVGVDDAAGHTGNLDNTTDHFIVIVGMGHNSNGNYFQFYDNASGSSSLGASALNLLYYNSTTGMISGTSQTSYGQGQPYPYILTMIRKSKLL